MGVLRIDNARYFGYRAQRSAAGEVRRKYFPMPITGPGKRGRRIAPAAEARIRAKAVAFDRELEAWQGGIKAEQVRQARPVRSGNTSGVSGISYRPTYKEMKRGRAYVYPVFAVGSLKPDGRALTRRFRIREGEERAAWRAACACLAEAKGISPAPLYRRFPADALAAAKKRAAPKKRAAAKPKVAAKPAKRKAGK